MSLSPRQVQRHIAALESSGLVQRIERTDGHGGKLSNVYDLSGVVDCLKKLEPEFSVVEKQVKTSRKAVAKPGHMARPQATEPRAHTRRQRRTRSGQT